MSSSWRRIGWQQIQVTVPADWFLTKIATERPAGDLWLNDADMPRLQLKWLDASREKSVDAKATLDRYLQTIEKQARKGRHEFKVERGLQLVGKGRRDISSIEGFSWRAETQAFGVIWYSREAQRVTLAQVNGALDEKDLKSLARQVLNSLHDAPTGDRDLWTAYDLECSLPRDYQLLGQAMETGRTELRFGRAKDTLTINRFGLAAIALERAGDLGDWAHGQRYKDWITFRLDREPGELAGHAAVTFRGTKRQWGEQVRRRSYNFLNLSYPVMLSARVWHCVEANCLYLVEHFRDARSDDLLDEICATIPATPTLLPGPGS